MHAMVQHRALWDGLVAAQDLLDVDHTASCLEAFFSRVIMLLPLALHFLQSAGVGRFFLPLRSNLFPESIRGLLMDVAIDAVGVLFSELLHCRLVNQIGELRLPLEGV